MLMVLEEDEETGDLAVRQVSEVSRELGLSDRPVASMLTKSPIVTCRIPPNCWVFLLATFSDFSASLTFCLEVRTTLCETISTTSQIQIWRERSPMRMRDRKFSCSVGTASPEVMTRRNLPTLEPSTGVENGLVGWRRIDLFRKRGIVRTRAEDLFLPQT